VSALCRYQLADLLRSQRWVAPLLTYTLFLAALYASDAGAAVPAFGVTAIALLPVSAWLTRVVLSVEDDAARQVTAATVGGQLRVQAALLVSAVVAAAPFVVLAVGWASVANAGNVTGWRAYLGGLGIHSVLALLGVGLGATLSRPLVRAPGAAALAIVGVVVVVLIVPWSPVAGLLRVLETDPHRGFAAQLMPSVVALLVLAAAAGALSLFAARRS
jgi:hypothetical protein